MGRRKPPRTKRILFVSDTHCGHKGGLCPPPWQCSPSRDDLAQHAWHSLQAEAWETTCGWLLEVGPVDCAVHLGDVIDGPGSRSAGTELVTSDLNEQVSIARACMDEVQTDRWEILYGTPYHTTADGQDWDAVLANLLGCSIHDHCWIECYGQIFDCKHKMGGSTTPMGGDIALRGEMVWAREWAAEHGWPRPDWLLRGHVHRERVVDWAQSVAALSTWTKYGGRQCRNYVHYGLAWADITPTGDVTWHRRKRTLEAGRPRLLRV